MKKEHSNNKFEQTHNFQFLSLIHSNIQTLCPKTIYRPQKKTQIKQSNTQITKTQKTAKTFVESRKRKEKKKKRNLVLPTFNTGMKDPKTKPNHVIVDRGEIIHV